MHAEVSICQGGEPENQHVKSPGVHLNINVGGVAFENVESLERLGSFFTINDQKENDINESIDLGFQSTKSLAMVHKFRSESNVQT